MAGFYLHIPFCRQACRYCDFYFTVSMKYKEDVIAGMLLEMKIRKTEYSNERFDTLYFGGGSPSVLEVTELDRILKAIHKHYHLEAETEFTLEANPDDLTIGYLKKLREMGINRLSIGVQSFRDKDLRLMRRSHTVSQAQNAIKNARKTGFENLSIDLIYGVPGMSTADFENNLKEALQFEISHLSAYHLTFEPGTVFDHWRKKGRLIPKEEAESLEQFSLLKEITSAENFHHYEISNFAREGFFSKHNLSYWKQVPYIGIGPSAHSYKGNIRRWNISSNPGYINSLLKNEGKYFDSEVLTLNDMYNEYILTSLRTMWGIDMNKISERFGEYYVKYTENTAKKFLASEMLEKNADKIKLSEKGIFAADYVMSEFFNLEKGK